MSKNNINPKNNYENRRELKTISSIEITNECLNLISTMLMGSNEYSKFLKTPK